MSSRASHVSDLETNKIEEEDAISSTGSTFQDSSLVSLDDHEDPQNMALWRKWVVVAVLSAGALCCTCLSSVASFTQAGVSADFHVSRVVATLSVSLFVLGLGLGPLLLGPVSELYGRNIVYRLSYGLLFAFSWPVVFPPNAAVYLVFRFVTGLCGSAFMSVVGGSIADMFSNANVGNAMALYTVSPFMGPILGPLIGGFVNQNLNWRWTYRVMIIWIFVEFVLVVILVPETFAPVLLQWKARRLRKSTGNKHHWAPLDRQATNVLHAMALSCYTPFKLIIFDQMAILLNLWTSLILGILYLSFEAFPIIFAQHGFDTQQTGLTFIGLGVGELMAFASTPFWNRLLARSAATHGGKAPPEARLSMGQLGGVLVPLSLFWIAFTTYPHVHWIVPIIASIPLGMGLYLVFNSVFTYLVVAYRPIAASAMASNSAMRSSFAAGFPLFAPAMYSKLGPVGATALLAGLTTVMAPLPFIFHRYGAHLRRNSPFAAR